MALWTRLRLPWRLVTHLSNRELLDALTPESSADSESAELTVDPKMGSHLLRCYRVSQPVRVAQRFFLPNSPSRATLRLEQRFLLSGWQPSVGAFCDGYTGRLNKGPWHESFTFLRSRARASPR